MFKHLGRVIEVFENIVERNNIKRLIYRKLLGKGPDDDIKPIESRLFTNFRLALDTRGLHTTLPRRLHKPALSTPHIKKAAAREFLMFLHNVKQYAVIGTPEASKRLFPPCHEVPSRH